MGARRSGRGRPVHVVRHRGRRPPAPAPLPSTTPPLSGVVDTGRLPRIAGEPVTVTVARRVAPGWEAEFLLWAEELLAAAKAAPGCLGGAVLHPGAGGGGEYQIVVRFVDGVHLRQFERSEVRNELMTRADRFVTSARLQRTVGVEEWFQAAAHAPDPRSRWRVLASDVAWVYPVAMLSALFVAPFVAHFPAWARVLFGTIVITLALAFTVGPLRRFLRARRRL